MNTIIRDVVFREPKPIDEPTEGPWEVGRNGTSIYTRDHQLIAVAAAEGDITLSEARANARRIAKLPAMEQLLREFLDDSADLLLNEGFARLGGLDYRERIHQVLAAIDGRQS